MQGACAVLYCHLWPVRLCQVFPHYIINDTIFGKTLLTIKCVSWFSVLLLSELFLILGIIQRDIVINVHRSSCKVPVVIRSRCSGPGRARTQTLFFCSTRCSYAIVTELEFALQTFAKSSNTKFHEYPFNGSRAVPCRQAGRQMDGRTGLRRIIVAFFKNSANALKNE